MQLAGFEPSIAAIHVLVLAAAGKKNFLTYWNEILLDSFTWQYIGQVYRSSENRWQHRQWLLLIPYLNTAVTSRTNRWV
jgi:membrane-bound metal-dependent hydrolase YbcI (DUF457 family)